MELTPHFCEHARALDMKPTYKTSHTHANKGTTSDSMYHTIVANAYQPGFLLSTDEEMNEIEERKKQCKGYWCSFSNICVKRNGQNKKDCIASSGMAS